MIPDLARLPVRSLRLSALTAALLAGLAVPLPLSAQDNNPGDCGAMPGDAIAGCPPAESAAAEDATAEPGPADYPLDWAPIGAVPEALRDLQCLLCSGRYLDPLADADRSVKPEDSDIRAWAKTTEWRGDTVYLTGGVSVVQGYRRFYGEQAEFNRAEGQAFLTGDVTVREPGILLRGDRAEIFTEQDKAILHQSEFILHEDNLRGSADLLRRDPQGLVHIHNGNFSYCPPGLDHWAIRANDIKLDLEEGLGVARGAKVDIKGVPIFYTPWLQFPLDDRRRTGLLWPDFGSDSSGGLDITVPVYFNLAPNYDALYSPRWIEERGLNHELKLRYLNPYAGYWTVGGAYMKHDDKYNPVGKSDDRWLAVVRQAGLFNERWRSRIDYNKVSDIDYMKDLESSSLSGQRRTSLLQRGSLDYLGDNWLVNLDVEQFQPLAEDIRDLYKKLPQLTGQYRGDGTPFTLQPIALAQYSNFDSDEDIVTGQRVYVEGGMTYPMSWSFGFLNPKLKYRQLEYDLSTGDIFTDSSPSAGSALAGVDGSLFFERPLDLAGKHLLQTFEPRLYYQYSEYEDQSGQPDFDTTELTFSYNQLFRETRFSGRDRLDDSNRLSVGLSSQFIDSETGQNLLGASVGQIFYFSNRKVRLLPGAPPLTQSSSEIAGELTFTPDEHLTLRSNLVWDPHTGNMASGNIQAGYTLDNGAIFNAGYAYSRPRQVPTLPAETDQVSASTYLPLNTQWRVFGAITYSLIDNKSLEEMAGIEYDNCCWTVRLMHLRYYNNKGTRRIDFDNPDLQQKESTQVQIILKGMGGFGSRITSILEDMIRGYEERDY